MTSKLEATTHSTARYKINIKNNISLIIHLKKEIKHHRNKNIFTIIQICKYLKKSITLNVGLTHEGELSSPPLGELAGLLFPPVSLLGSEGPESLLILALRFLLRGSFIVFAANIASINTSLSCKKNIAKTKKKPSNLKYFGKTNLLFNYTTIIHSQV